MSSSLPADKTRLMVEDDIKPLLGEGVQLGKLNIRTDPESRMYTFFYSDRDGRPAAGPYPRQPHAPVCFWRRLHSGKCLWTR